ncbi:MAG: 50S ribosomal protein L23 [Candidatus Aminicenantes bacterium]|nr:50S ribosomal protein L23 [Candidatus Aminicenantes bacterium]
MSVHNPYKVIIKPVITEKSTMLKEKERSICFEVHPRANKIEIKDAVEKLFDVKVDKVRIVKKRGKKKRMGRSEGRTKDWKKAYVTLKKGEKMIEYFEAV